MNDDRVGGALMLAAAGGIAWAYLTGRLAPFLDRLRRAIVSTAGAAPATPGSSGRSGFDPVVPGAGAGGGGGGGGGGGW